jgi:hypothetical protein
LQHIFPSFEGLEWCSIITLGFPDGELFKFCREFKNHHQSDSSDSFPPSQTCSELGRACAAKCKDFWLEYEKIVELKIPGCNLPDQGFIRALEGRKENIDLTQSHYLDARRKYEDLGFLVIIITGIPYMIFKLVLVILYFTSLSLSRTVSIMNLGHNACLVFLKSLLDSTLSPRMKEARKGYMGWQTRTISALKADSSNLFGRSNRDSLAILYNKGR